MKSTKRIGTPWELEELIKSDLSFVVRAVNNFDQIMDALDRIANGQWPQDIAETEGTLAMRDVARAALAKCNRQGGIMKTKQEEALRAVDTIALGLVSNPRNEIVDLREMNRAVAILENFIHEAGETADKEG